MDFLASLGAVCLAYISYKVAIDLYGAFTIYFFPERVDYSKYGKWSVITGASDGIGKAIAFQLAAHGQNVILIARNEDKLKTVANEIKSRYKVLTKHLKIDFTDDERIYDEIRAFLQNADIGVLVNNVGIGNDPCPFLEQSNLPKLIRDITRVNVISMMKMIEIVLPDMVSNHRGLILNVSSAASILPLFSFYGATKAFMGYLSESLSYEYKDKGITIQHVMPCFVRTKMVEGVLIKSKLLMPDPDEFAAAVVAATDKSVYTYGCWQHALQVWFLSKLPTKAVPFVFKHVLGVESLFQKKKQ